jgi:hypothetical protein
LAQASLDSYFKTYKYSTNLVPISSPLGHPGGNAKKAKVLAVCLEAQLQPVIASSVPAVIEMVDVTLSSYFVTPASETNLTKPDEVQGT